MGQLRFSDGGERRTLPLAPSTLVGRSWACIARFHHPTVPLYWMEVRWYGGAWAWRVLAGAAHTRGAGASVGDSWRSFSGPGGRPPRVTLDEAVWVELVNDSPPQPFAVDAFTGEPIASEELLNLVEVHNDALLPLDAEGDENARLRDGELFRAGDRVLRAHVPGRIADTEGRRMHFEKDEIEVGIDLEALVARFSNGPLAVEARGECVRVLAAYHRVRESGIPEGGWLTPNEALAEWIDLGGTEASHAERMSWERSRVRSQLSRAGVGGLDRLFEIRREGDTVRCRLGAVTAYWI